MQANVKRNKTKKLRDYLVNSGFQSQKVEALRYFSITIFRGYFLIEELIGLSETVYTDLILTKLDIDKITKLTDGRYVIIP